MEPAPTTETGPWDPLIGELHAARRRAGEPSYAEIARRITAQRQGEGASEHAARIAKSSVHDAFRLGRTRINVPLTREIVRALGEPPELVDGWLAPVEPVPAPVAGPTRAQVAALLVACTALNLVGREFVDLLRLPLYLDMVGTALAAFALGPWRAVGVGVATNVIGVLGSGWVSLPFTTVNVVGALVLGWGVHRWAMGRDLPRFLALNALAACACTAFAVPVVAALYGESPRIGHDVITVLVRDAIGSFWVALSLSNLLTSLVDKLIGGFVALVVVSALPAWFRRALPVAG